MNFARALHDWRQWQIEPPLLAAPRVVEQLSADQYNLVVKVSADTSRGPSYFVVRLRTHHAHALAPDVTFEARFMGLASQRQLAPCLRYVCTARGLLVMDYVDNRTLVSTELLADLINGIHAIPIQGQPLDLAVQLGLYTHMARSRGVAKEDLIDPLLPALQTALSVLANDKPVLCHNDLHVGNILHNGEHLLAIDWEYAGIGSAYFDVVSAVEGCPTVDQAQLIEQTLGAGFSSHTWQCAQALYAAMAWNWYQASGIQKPAGYTRAKVARRLSALVL